MTECNCILQRTVFKIWQKHSWIHDFMTFGTPDHEYVITIHADNLTDLDSKIESIKKELLQKHQDCTIRDFAL